MIEQVDAAKNAFIESAIEDLQERFSGMNEDTAALEIFYNLMDTADAELETNIEVLSMLYSVDPHKLQTEIQTLKSLLSASGKKFSNYKDMAKYCLNTFDDDTFPTVLFFFSLILVLPFSAADAERAFSAMNEIKSKKRNRLLEILRSLMTIYTSNADEFEVLKII